MMMSESQYDGGSQMIFSSPATATPANRDTFGIVPLTIKQISEASHSGDDKSNFSLSGSDLANVTVVGMVSNIVEKNVNATFTVDDGTGKLECRIWLNEPYDTLQMGLVKEGIYVHVDGHLKSFKGQRHVDVFSVRPVTNFDEITFHFIACIHNNMLTSKLVPKTEGGDVNATPSTPIQNKTNGFTKSATSSQEYKPSVDGGLEDIDDKIYSYLMAPENIGSEAGVSIYQIKEKLKLPINKITESIRSLCDAGRVYSTTDEEHYKGI